MYIFSLFKLKYSQKQSSVFMTLILLLFPDAIIVNAMVYFSFHLLYVCVCHFLHNEII